ncbi:MarR family transcriptional regulator [Bacillus velezensis]|uniref:MarR family transcriptional regulator n=1 Tax=Bacillus amyloliquefaciens group TaxID=1938374 RepID=UPI0007B6AE90|nr:MULTISPECIES: MarR family transcriptional regulator [Bacillus amyloliquefaciens group]ANB82768.1 MarR family transcriptional regulator [Bacillus velezensis]MEC2311334.1 MarR family transcriptional regulator [Bacillus velezensis]QOH65236.1 MarR family transcriptional regulator [Bacillus amyloliquefaciens]
MNNNTSKKQNKDRLIMEVWETAIDMLHKLQSVDDEEKQWLIQNSQDPVVAESMKEMTVLMLHVLEAIGRLEPVNGITISKQFGISRGSVSKITRKLAEKEIILVENIPDNKKEILFRTTPLGKEILLLHQDLHHQIDSEINRFFQRYTEDELGTVLNVLRDALHTSWINPTTNEEEIAHSPRVAQINEKEELDTGKASRSYPVAEEMYEITEMLNKLDSRNLKKAKVILNEIFFSDYDD